MEEEEEEEISCEILLEKFPIVEERERQDNLFEKIIEKLDENILRIIVSSTLRIFFRRDRERERKRERGGGRPFATDVSPWGL